MTVPINNNPPPDRRGAGIHVTEAGFGFAPLAAALGIDPPKGTTLWLDAIPVKDKKGKPVMVIPVGDKIKRQAVQDAAAGKQDDAGGQG